MFELHCVCVNDFFFLIGDRSKGRELRPAAYFRRHRPGGVRLALVESVTWILECSAADKL